jgi:endonuclease YncB( thermonuclease family)
MVLSFVLIMNPTIFLQGAVFKGWCMKVVEGDTIMVYVNKKMLNIRLAYIDCPEMKQLFGPEALKFTSDLILKKKIQVKIESYTENGQMIGRVHINGEDLSMTLIKAGLAWYYKEHGSERYLLKAQRKAKRSNIGLWSQKKPIAPWIFREGDNDQK